MKRIHLVEFEDLGWFPNWLRICLTRLIVVMHKLLGSSENLADLITGILRKSNAVQIVDLCSGSGGPMLEVFNRLKNTTFSELQVRLTDFYPNLELASQINEKEPEGLSYETTSVNALSVPPELKGLRTMIGCFHHFKPVDARQILKNAIESKQPICIYEISDNNLPTIIWWISLPMIFLMSFFITPFVRPLTLKQIIFTYIIPVIPLCFAWDGAVSNARTYTLKDLEILLEGLRTDDYEWEMGKIEGMAKKIFLLGTPNAAASI